MSNFDRLWAKKYSGWPETELTGLLPLSFLSKGETLTDYRIYGTESGAGVQTENLLSTSSLNNVTWGFNVTSTFKAVLNSLPVGTYTFVYTATLTARNDVTDNSVFGFVFRSDIDTRSRWGSTAIGESMTTTYTFTITNETIGSFNNCYAYGCGINGVGITGSADFTDMMIIFGSTLPTSYIPFGYKIPLTVESGEQQSNYDLFIGSTKLGEEEYVDYAEQKVYKRTENFINPNETEQGEGYIANTILTTTGTVAAAWGWTTEYIRVSPSTTYCFFTDLFRATLANAIIAIYNSEREAIQNVQREGHLTSVTYSAENCMTFTTPANAYYLRLSVDKNGTMLMLTEGSTAPAQYIPYLQPTEPPAPFPPISTYKGENTLSSTETVGEVSVTGKIKEAP
jgi:hypothetical protein